MNVSRVFMLSLHYYITFILLIIHSLKQVAVHSTLMALNMKEFLSTGRFLQEKYSSKSFHDLPTQALALPIITKTFDWAESKFPGRSS